MTQDLVERLWDCQHEAQRLAHAMPGDDGKGFQVFANAFHDARASLKQAADRIEALEADVLRWQAHGMSADDRCIGLEAALNEFMSTYAADENCGDPSAPQDCWSLARAALHPQEQKEGEK